jgi:hypothetical protein
MEKTPGVESVMLDLDRRSQNQNVISVPPAFAIASPSLELGEAMAKAGGSIPLAEPELSPLFFAGNSVATPTLFAPRPAEVCQVDSRIPDEINSDS